MENRSRSAPSHADVSPRAQLAGLACLALIGIGLRTLGLARAMWIDEAWVLDSIHSANLHDMFYYTGWAQTTPPGVLLLLRIYGQLSGAQAEAFRLLPLLASSVTLVLGMLLARRVLSFGFAMLAAVVLVCSPELLWYGTEIKQYPFDLLAATLMLTLGFAYLHAPSRPRLWAWFATYTVLAVCSYTLAFFLPALVVVAVLHESRHGWPSGRRSLVLWILIAIAVTVAVYVGVARPNADVPTLHAFWRRGFYASAGLTLPFYVLRLAQGLFAFLPNAILSRGMLAALLVLSAWGALRGGHGGQASPVNRRAVGMLLALPLLSMLAANALGLYPASEFRLLQFLTVNCLLLSLLGVEALGAALCARLSASPTTAATSVLGMVLALATTFAYFERSTRTEFVHEPWRGNMDVRDVLRYLQARNDLHRPVFVTGALRQYFAVYQAVYPLRVPVLQGEVGWPCCIPGRTWHTPEYAAAEISQEVKALLDKLHGAIFYAAIRSNKSAITEAMLYDAAWVAEGCVVDPVLTTTGMKLLRVACPGAGQSLQ